MKRKEMVYSDGLTEIKKGDTVEILVGHVRGAKAKVIDIQSFAIFVKLIKSGAEYQYQKNEIKFLERGEE